MHDFDLSICSEDELIQLDGALSLEMERFNNCINSIQSHIDKVKSKECTQQMAVDNCLPFILQLRDLGCQLKILNPKEFNEDITEEEISEIREILMKNKGAIKIMRNNINNEITNEAFGDTNYLREIRQSPNAKKANEYMKQAKKLYSYGDKTKAYSTLDKAEDLYEKCLADVETRVKRYDVERSVKLKSTVQDSTDTYTKSVTDSRLSYAIDYFEDRIENCKALRLQWDNKAGSNDFKETKKALKEERKLARREGAKNRKFRPFKKFGKDIVSDIDSAVEAMFE